MVFELSKLSKLSIYKRDWVCQELAGLKSKFSTSNNENWWKISTVYEGRGGVRKPSKFFTERGLYMLATILKSERATQATLSIVETFAKVRELKRELLAMHQDKTNKRRDIRPSFYCLFEKIMSKSLS